MEMTDKVQKIREEVERLQDLTMDKNKNFYSEASAGEYYALCNIEHFIDSLQEEPVSSIWHDASEKSNEPEEVVIINPSDNTGDVLTRCTGIYQGRIWAYTSELLKLSNLERIGKNWKEEPVSEDLEEELDSYIKDNFTIDKEQLDRFGLDEKDYMYSMDKSDMLKMVRHFTELKHKKDVVITEDLIATAFANGMADMKQQMINAHGCPEEPVSEDLGEYISVLSKQFPEVSFAKLSRIAVRVAKWQRENLWKPADGDDLPEIDREVIALLDNGKVVFAHRPPEFWDGKNIVTGKVTRNYPKTYDKGGWNIPDVKFWLDVELPKEIEL